MAIIVTVAKDQGNGTFNGSVNLHIPGASATQAQGLPVGITSMNRRPIGLSFQKRFYLIGQFSRPLARTEFRQWWPMGIYAPTAIPTLSAGSGSGGSVAACRGKLTFAERHNNKLVHESAGSDVSNTLDVTGEGRIWTGIPPNSVDARVNVVRGYLSFDGDLFRNAWERPLGTTTVEENVRSLQRGEALNDNRGVPPYTQLAARYHGRFFYGMDPRFPYRLWYSENSEPESVGALSFRNLPDGIPVTGLSTAGMNNDTLVIFGRRSTFDLQGYGGTDFNLRNVDPVYGCIAPAGPQNVHGFLIFPSQRGLCMYAGSAVHFLGDDLETFWREDYAANQAAYDNGFATDDKKRQVYKFTIIRQGSPFTFTYVLHYQDIDPARLVSGRMPRITFDVRARTDSSAGNAADPTSQLEENYTGSCDGFVRRENVETDPDDDGDAYQKLMVRQSPHDYFEDVGGSRTMGKVFSTLTTFIVNENQPGSLKLYAGPDAAPDGVPAFTIVIPAGALAGKVESDEFYAIPHIAGTGLTRRVEIPGPVGVKLRGDAGSWMPGLKTRPATP